MKHVSLKTSGPALIGSAIILGLSLSATVLTASENVPHRAFGMWADLPAPGEFDAGIVYEESESYHFWAGSKAYGNRYKSDGESYGIDINQGYLAFQYGLTPKWALDLNVGATTAGYRYFSDGHIESTTGISDSSFGIRYQLFNEAEADSPWTPTLTLRAGGVVPGTYDKDFAFAPGMHSAAVEPNVLLRKQFGWPGLGAYADALYRLNFDTGDQYIAVIGFFQKIKSWELAVGYRHVQTLSGDDIKFDAGDPTSLVYPRDVREINDTIEAGFSYTTVKRHIRLGFHSRTIVDGSNSDGKFWVGGSVDFPFGGSRD